MVTPSTARRFRLPPVTCMALALAVGLAVLGGVMLLALSQPWLGLKLAPADAGLVVVRAQGPSSDVPPGSVLTHVAGQTDSLDVEAGDLIVEPDGVIPDYASYRAFVARQDHLARILRDAPLVFTDAQGRAFTVHPGLDGRPLGSMPADFWVGLVVGLVAWLVSAAVFACRPEETSARYLLLSGAATLIFAPAAVVYSSRELAVPGMLFRWASDLNFLGGSLFAASFVALLLHYPRRLAPGWVGATVVIAYLTWFAAQQADAFESKIFARRFLVMIGVAATFVLAGVHWLRSRREPVDRAALQWFLLSWVLGTGLFALFILLPQTFGIDTTPIQGHAFLLFLLVYGGLAFGILRYRLFELGNWWRRIVVWAATALMLVLLDLFFLFGMHLSSGTSLALSLLLCGVVWLPLRGWLWGRFTNQPEIRTGQAFSRIIGISLMAPEDANQKQAWRELLNELFDPLRITLAGSRSAVSETSILQEGLVMELPRVGSIPSLRLEYARGGRALFTPRDAALAADLLTMLDHGMRSRAAYGKGAEEERARIARDMHDNIGSQLLAALHSWDPASKDAKIREALADLRDVINNASGDHRALDETLAELRVETADRLAAANIDLDWTSDAGDEGHGPGPAVTHALRSIIREAVSNVIRHAQARHVTIAVGCQSDVLLLEIRDDGKGFDPASTGSGHGIANIRARLLRLQGELEIRNTGAGSRLVIRIPLTQHLPMACNTR